MTVDLEFKSSWSSETYLPHTINPFSHATLSSYLRNGYVPPSSRAIEVLNGLQRDISWALDDCDEEIYEKEEQIRPLELRLAEVKKIRSQLVAIGRRALSVTALDGNFPQSCVQWVIGILSSAFIFHRRARQHFPGESNSHPGTSLLPMATSRVFVLCDLWGSMQIDLQAIGRYSSVGNVLIQHIRRSDTMPLRLSVKTTCPYYKLSDEALGVWHALTQESHRWKDVVLDVVPQLLDITRRNFSKLGDDDASKLLRFPILETLRIENLNDIHDYIRRNDSDPLHFLQALPSLQSLHIHGSLFAVTFTLDVARITRLSIPDGLFIGKSLAQLFHSCPCLQNIELGGFFFQEGRLWSMPDITLPVVHTHLTRLCLITKNAGFSPRGGLASVSFPNLASVELIGTERGYSKGLGEDLASLIARSNCNNFSHLTLTSIPGLEALPVLRAAKGSLRHLKVNNPRMPDDVLLKELSLGLNPHMDLVPALVSLEVFISPWVFRTLVGGPSYILPIESSICGLIKSRCSLTATSVDSESNPRGWILTNPLRSLKVVLHKDTKSTIQTAADDDLYSLAIGVMEEIYQGVIFNFGDRYLDDLESAGLELCIG